MKRIENSEKIKTVFNDFKMASEIHNNNQLDEVEKNEYEARIEMGNKKIIDIYIMRLIILNLPVSNL